jgi:flavin-dependent dehydrogenase
MRIRAKNSAVAEGLAPAAQGADSRLRLDDGDRVAVVGGGPAGAFFAYFVLGFAKTLGLELEVDIFEPRHFTHSGPAGCNHCGGIVSESLVQLLALEGIELPPSVIQRGIDSYVLHSDVGTVRIDTPLQERRIAAVFRGNGPRDAPLHDEQSFDRYLLDLAVERGARVVPKLVDGIEWEGGYPYLQHPDQTAERYDLAAIGVGINSNLLRVLEASDIGYRRPETTMTYICEFDLGRDTVEKYLGTSMHVFLLDMPRLEFAALIPKGEVVTMCMLGDEIDNNLVESFLNTPEVRQCLPPGDLPPRACNCSPLINVSAAARPFGDRLVFLGDSGVTRLYKDGIGAAYRTAKAAATTVVFEGISEEDFRTRFWKVCRTISLDNALGKFVFKVNNVLKKRRFSRRAIFRMTALEQQSSKAPKHMSGVLWDLFTGSAPYREVLTNTLHPGFIVHIVWNLVIGMLPGVGWKSGIAGIGEGREKDERATDY